MNKNDFFTSVLHSKQPYIWGPTEWHDCVNWSHEVNQFQTIEVDCWTHRIPKQTNRNAWEDCSTSSDELKPSQPKTSSLQYDEMQRSQ